METIKGILWRLFYVAVLIAILAYALPLLLALVGLSIPGGPAIALIKFALACLLVIFVFFGPPPPTPF